MKCGADDWTFDLHHGKIEVGLTRVVLGPFASPIDRYPPHLTTALSEAKTALMSMHLREYKASKRHETWIERLNKTITSFSLRATAVGSTGATRVDFYGKRLSAVYDALMGMYDVKI